jgi:hypothetical protein
MGPSTTEQVENHTLAADVDMRPSGWKQILEGLTPPKPKPVPTIKRCLQCGKQFTRKMKNGKLYWPKRWRRMRYCSRECCGAYRGAKPDAGFGTWLGSLAALEPPKPGR